MFILPGRSSQDAVYECRGVDAGQIIQRNLFGGQQIQILAQP
jgi:hypothetical protein